MRCYWIIALAVVATASAQVPSIGIQPMGPRISSSTVRSEVGNQRVSAAGPPLFGYVAGPSPAELRAVVGRINALQLGEPIAVPDNTEHLYLSPRQLYALVEKNSNEPLAVWTLHGAAASATKQAAIAVAGIMAHPDLVAFSPRGTASVLYSQTSGDLQPVGNLPAQPSISKQLSLSSLGMPSQIAISDDAALVVVAFTDGRVGFSLNGSGWSPLPMSFTLQAWSFVPNTHDLVIGDPAQKTIVLLTNVEDSSRSSRILAQNVEVDRLAVTKDGQQLVAANSGAGQIWTIDLKTGSVTAREGTANVETLSSLRDGFTFLLSTSPTVSVLRLSASPNLLDAAALAQTTNTKH